MSNFHPDTRGQWWSLFFRPLVQSCCGEGGTLHTKITSECGECSQCLGHTGFAPAHSMCAFPFYTAQALGCSARNCLRQALGCMYFPGLSHSGSGSWVLHKDTDMVGPAFCALPRSEQLRWPDAWWVQSPPRCGVNLTDSPVPAAQFSGYTMGVPSQVCRVSLLGSWSLAVTLPADVDHPESQEVLVSNRACFQFGKGCLSGAVISPFQLWLPLPACLWWGMGRSKAGWLCWVLCTVSGPGSVLD